VRAAPPAAGLDWACFAGLSPWEVVAGGRKIAGLAQVRRRQGVLLVGGVLLDGPDWPLLCSVLRRPAAEAQGLAQCTTSWAQQGGPPVGRSRFAQVLQQRLQSAIGLRQASLAPAPEPA
jgi:lipoate-protein ligase A